MHKKQTFANGFRILVAPNKGTRTITILVLAATGSKYETKEINGISHFLEHLFFKGTKKRPGFLDISQEIDRIGGVMNAFTAQEYTGYWAKVDANHFQTALDIVSDIFLNSTLPKPEIERERGVIIEEINMYLDTPMRRVAELFEEVLYGDQPAGWPIAGRKEVIARLTRRDFLQYWSSQYTAANTLVCIAGNISPVRAFREAARAFRGIPGGTPKGKNVVIEQQKKPSMKIEHKESDQTHVCIGVRAYNLFDPRRYAAGVLSVLLGGGMSSRMFIAVRERQGLAYYVHTEMDQYTDSGFLVTQAGVDNTKADRAIRTILREYKKIAAQRVGKQELEKAKNYIKGRTAIDLESSDERASWVATQELLEGRVLATEEVFRKIDGVSAGDIQRVAQDIFRSKKLNMAIVGPFRERDFRKVLHF